MYVMYFVLFLLFIIAALCAILFHHRRKKIICKIRSMEKCEKCDYLGELSKPFGYLYHCCCGSFSSTLDAWQKEAGYTYLYDYLSPRFQMVFDSLPVYFDYNGKTWLVQFWKGQYGINTGAEIGIYHADRIISPKEYKTTLFTGAYEEEMLPMTLKLTHKDKYVRISQTHWWLTSFLAGSFANPDELETENSILFPDMEMLTSFLKGMTDAGISSEDVSVSGHLITFRFHTSGTNNYSLLTRFRRWYSQQKNRLFCNLYLAITQPFTVTEDRVLYLYYFLPFAFRRLLRLHRFDKRCHRRKRCMRKCRKKSKKHTGKRKGHRQDNTKTSQLEPKP